MKKLLAISLVSFTFLLASFSVNAQEEKLVYIKDNAKVQALELQKMLGLDNEQTTLLVRTIYAKDKSLTENISGKDTNDQENLKLKDKIHTDFKRNLRGILTEEQFERYLKWLSSQDKK